MKILIALLTLCLAACASSDSESSIASAHQGIAPQNKDGFNSIHTLRGPSSKKVIPALPILGEKGRIFFSTKNCSYTRTYTQGKHAENIPVDQDIEIEFSRESHRGERYLVFSHIFSNEVYTDGKPEQVEKVTRTLDDVWGVADVLAGREISLEGMVHYTTRTSYDNKTGTCSTSRNKVTRIAGVDVAAETADISLSIGKDKLVSFRHTNGYKTWDLLTNKQRDKVRKRGDWAQAFVGSSNLEAPSEKSGALELVCKNGSLLPL